MISLPWLGAGVVVGFVVVVYARRGGAEREKRVFAAGLAVASAIYVGFALVGRADGFSIALESGGLLAFGLLAWTGYRRSQLILAAGWALHVSWDVWLHLLTPQPFVDIWYPNLCITFDLAVAGYLAWEALRRGGIEGESL